MVSGIVSQSMSGATRGGRSEQPSRIVSGSTSGTKAVSEPVNIEQLRHSLKEKWLTYYCENREWLVQLSVWVNCDGKYRPSASFILATLTALEPQLTRLMPLLSGLNSSPDRIVSALGLNFNPDDIAEHWLQQRQRAAQTVLLPSKPEDGDIAFHPEAMLLNPTMSLERSSKQNHASLNGHHHPISQQAITNGHDGVQPNTSADDMGKKPNPQPTPQQIARKDEQCGGRDRTRPDNIWR